MAHFSSEDVDSFKKLAAKKGVSFSKCRFLHIDYMKNFYHLPASAECLSNR